MPTGTMTTQPKRGMAINIHNLQQPGKARATILPMNMLCAMLPMSHFSIKVAALTCAYFRQKEEKRTWYAITRYHKQSICKGSPPYVLADPPSVPFSHHPTTHMCRGRRCVPRPCQGQ